MLLRAWPKERYKNMTRITDITLTGLNGQPLPLSQFAGRPMVVVNTASRCGFTSQYGALQQLWTTHREAGLVVLGVPSNDFGAQEPGTAEEIANFCTSNYKVTFPMTAKMQVQGSKAHPLFQWLASRGGALSYPRWNFFKYLIGRDGELKDWFSSLTAPDNARFQRAINRLLK
jgi:glutathione peroxidase